MTLKQWLNNAQAQLQAKGIASAQIDSELLLAHVLHQDKAYLLSHSEDSLPPQKIKEATTLLQRRLAHEPLAYILGYKEFFGLTIKTDKRALIPRWESECLVEAADDWLQKHPHARVIAEVGTGSGAIILSLAKKHPNHTFFATEISPEALALAQDNAQQIGLNAITFLPGDLGQPLTEQGLHGKIDLLVANLPYIPTPLLKNLDPTVTYYEPNLALEGGEDGLDYYRRFLPQAVSLLAPGGLLLCEHDYDQGEAMRQIAQTSFPHAQITTLTDYLRHDRVLSLT